jgi:transposase
MITAQDHDVVDAIAMAKQLSVTDWQPEPELSQPLRQLRSLTRLRLDFVEEQSSWVNRIRAVINQIYPEIEPLLKDLTAATSLAVLTRYPSRQALATADITELTDCVQKASRQNKGAEFAQQLQQTAAASVGLDDPCLAAELRLMLCQLQSLLANIHALEQELRHYTELVLHSYSTRLGLTKPLNLKSFPYGNYVTLATLLAELGDVQRFPTLKHLLSYLGWCPNTHESGLSQVAHPRMSHRGNRFARRIVWLMSVGAVRWVAEYRAYFQQRVAGGKNKMKTLVAIGRKLLSVFYAVLKTGRPYETQRYLERPALPIAT